MTVVSFQLTVAAMQYVAGCTPLHEVNRPGFVVVVSVVILHFLYLISDCKSAK